MKPVKAFIVHTDYTLLSAVMTKRTHYPGECADLYVVMQKRNSKELLDAVRDEFVNVYELEPYENKQSYIWIFQRTKWFKHYKEQLSPEKYEEIFCGLWDKAVYIAKHISVRWTKINFIEEGGVFYDSRNHLTKRALHSPLHHTLISVFHFDGLFWPMRNRVDKIFLYAPELYDAKLKATLKKIEFSDLHLKLLVCSYRDNDCIHLGTLPQGQERIEKTYYKPHPLESPQLPVELYYSKLTKSELESKVIIGSASSALLTPKTIFGCEPFIISTHKFDRPSNEKKYKETLFAKLCSFYEDQSKLYAPNSYDELDSLLEELSNV